MAKRALPNNPNYLLPSVRGHSTTEMGALGFRSTSAALCRFCTTNIAWERTCSNELFRARAAQYVHELDRDGWMARPPFAQWPALLIFLLLYYSHYYYFSFGVITGQTLHNDHHKGIPTHFFYPVITAHRPAALRTPFSVSVCTPVLVPSSTSTKFSS